MFSKRIENRKNLWWGGPQHPQSLLQSCQRLAMLHWSMSADAPEKAWRRGTYWQRRLLNKRNSKQFAHRLQVPTPELYWCGRYLNRSALNALPERFVIKPVLGRACQGVHVISCDRDLISNRRIHRDDLLDEIASRRGKFSHIPLLAEELVRDERQEDSLPIDYKFYMHLHITDLEMVTGFFIVPIIIIGVIFLALIFLINWLGKHAHKKKIIKKPYAAAVIILSLVFLGLKGNVLGNIFEIISIINTTDKSFHQALKSLGIPPDQYVLPEDVEELHALFELVKDMESTTIYLNNKMIPYIQDLWLFLMWFYNVK